MRTLVPVICLILFYVTFPGCNRVPENYYESGVSTALAEARNNSISDIKYTLKLEVPANEDLPVQGVETIDFVAKATRNDLLIDFRESHDKITELKLNGDEPEWSFNNDHIVIQGNEIKKGGNQLLIRFTAGDLSLNRNNEFMYSLFVPDRASTAFPCFDQPNLKAKFRLTLVIDSSWNAISNNPLIEESVIDGKKVLEFGEGKPISTYLFAFAAGKFSVEERSVDGIRMQMLHRETREELVSMNIDEIFSLHANAIRWLEDYTAIEYPFDKFGFVLIPSFQYGGMEHPGSIYYRAGSLLLEDNPSLNQKLSRASLIAHETAHIWFGDLVTMDWFNDVWLKEVFAGFMSDKITNPSFPELNHDLRFLLGRYPAAYSVDRTAGTNPVIQELDNMKNAGTLYGAIIYNKAPIVMKHLELMIGEDKLRDGLKEYLYRYSFNNAKWDDLVEILDPLSDADIKSWSEVWVKEAGRPVINTAQVTEEGKNSLAINEFDNSGKERNWPQSLETLIICEEGHDTLVTDLPATGIIYHPIQKRITGYIPDYNGVTYGLIKMPPSNIYYLLENMENFKMPYTRGIIMLNIFENMLEGIISPDYLLDAIINRIPLENDQLLMNQLRGMMNDIFWHYLDSETRKEFCVRIEKAILDKIEDEKSSSEQRSWFNTFVSISMSKEALDMVFDTWNKEKDYGNIRFNEPDFTGMACNLALKNYPGAPAILELQASRITNSDRRDEFMFIIQPLDSAITERKKFFMSLKDEANREHEPWVTRALGYLHHPLNEASSARFIPESLELLEEIQKTGDIFFPGQWISSTLEGHNSEEAFLMVDNFLEANKDYPQNLRLKILQAADHLYRKYGVK